MKYLNDSETQFEELSNSKILGAPESHESRKMNVSQKIHEFQGIN